MTETEIQLAAVRYHAGESAQAIGKSMGVSGEVVRYYLRQAGMRLRKPSRRRGTKGAVQPSTKRMQKLRARKLTYRRIGELMGLNTEAVRKRLSWHKAA